MVGLKAKQFIAALSLCLLPACASQKYLKSRGHSAFENRNYATAAQEFAKDAAKPGVNQLLFILDEATALFANRQYKESIELFLRAEKIAEIKDYTSISEEVGVIASGENVRGYKGEDFEKVLINVYLSMAFAALGNFEDAQVEARKINLLLYRMINEGKRNYQESPFARYFSAAMWEASGEWNSAYIDYKKTYELDLGFPDIGKDLLNSSQKMKYWEAYKEWKTKFPSLEPRTLKPGEGEVIVMFERGLSPMKIPRDGQESTLPRFRSRSSLESGARLAVNGVSKGQLTTVLDIDALSKAYLEDRIGRMIAAKIAGTAGKAAIAYGLGKATKNESLGWIAFLAMSASDHADVRSWRTLPADLQMLRVPVRAGKHKLDLEILSGSGNAYRTVSFGEVEIKSGKKTVLIGR